MAQVRTRSTTWITTRLCPQCGYAGHELQGRGEHSLYECPRCDQDLYARPAMSYAEMEGISTNAEGEADVAEPEGDERWWAEHANVPVRLRARRLTMRKWLKRAWAKIVRILTAKI